MTVDEILEAGRYTDRRGRGWHYHPENSSLWFRLRNRPVDGSHCEFVPVAQMRLLIERNMHRDVCPGLRVCGDHPVHHAVFYRWEQAFRVYEPDPNSVETIRCGTLPEAMDAARALAVGE